MRKALLGLSLLVIGASAGLALVACSESTPGASDAGVKKDSGSTARDAGGDDSPPISNPDSGTPGQDAGAPSCAAYCAAIDTNCTGANKQYPSTADCLKQCPFLPVGAVADTTGNTVGCRAYHAGAASGAPAVHCPHAGPYGGGLCGERCPSFCQVAQGLCPPAADAGGFASASACATACSGFTVADAGEGASGPTSGNTLNCRGYHLQAASSLPAVHCPHITAGGPCS